MKKTLLLSFIFSSLTIIAQVQETESIPNEDNLKGGIHPSIHESSPNGGGQDFDKTNYLTGDWGGTREEWVANGIDPFLFYASIAGSNVSGGLDQASAYGGQIYAGFKLDFERLLGWKGTRAKISTVNRHGNGLIDQVGSIYNPVTVVGGQTTFLYDLSVEKDFGNKLSLKVGRVAAADDFSSSTLYKFSLSNAINGAIRPLLLDRLMSTFPFPIWGARLKYMSGSKHRFQLGTYQFSKNTFDATRNGLDFSFRSSDDLSLFFQYDWFGTVANRPARVYLGAHQVFGTLANLDAMNESDYFVRFYGHADVELIDGLRSFLILSYASKGEIARVPFQISLGLNWKGLIKSRPDDRALFFATYASFSDEFAISQANELSSEIVFELGYRFQIIKYFALQPSVQYDIRPGGSGAIDNAFIPGIGILANF